jgi:phosphatidate phosphatase
MQPVSITKILFDAVSLIVLIVLFFVFQFALKPFKSGFYCNDFSINLPFRKSTVPNAYLIVISLVAPLVLIVFTELIRLVYIKVDKSGSSSSRHVNYIYKLKCIGNKLYNIPEQVGNLYVNLGSFFFGLLVTNLITNLGKYALGRLRPNFLSVCKPDRNPYTQVCTSGINYLQPEIDFFCTTGDKSDIEDSRLSFPSGHSSLSFYSMIFVILFINQTWNCRTFGLMPRIVQFFLFSVAFYTSLTRITDNKHHATDVIAGALLGIVVAIVTFFCLTDFLKKRNYKVRYECVQTVDEERVDLERGCTLFPQTVASTSKSKMRPTTN